VRLGSPGRPHLPAGLQALFVKRTIPSVPEASVGQHVRIERPRAMDRHHATLRIRLDSPLSASANSPMARLAMLGFATLPPAIVIVQLSPCGELSSTQASAVAAAFNPYFGKRDGNGGWTATLPSGFPQRPRRLRGCGPLLIVQSDR